jgi:hypothetical protein
MKKNVLAPHEDGGLNWIRALAMGAVGFYLYKSFKKEGSVANATMGRVKEFNINTDRIVDSVMPWVTVPDAHKQMISDAAKEFCRNLKSELLNKKSVNKDDDA